MIKHVVMFRFRDDVSLETQKKAACDFKNSIERLPEVIPFIRTVFVGLNVNAAEPWHICLESQFDTLDDVKAYASHPAHKAVASELMKYVGERACVDFEQ